MTKPKRTSGKKFLLLFMMLLIDSMLRIDSREVDAYWYCLRNIPSDVKTPTNPSTECSVDSLIISLSKTLLNWGVR